MIEAIGVEINTTGSVSELYADENVEFNDSLFGRRLNHDRVLAEYPDSNAQ